MTVSVLSENVNIVLNHALKKEEAAKPAAGYSALQNPDMNRLQLSAILRRRTAEGAKKAAKFFWSSFTNIYGAAHANANKDK